MKIAIDISQIAYSGSGVGTYTRNFVRSLLAADGKNEYILFGYSIRKINLLNSFLSEMKAINTKVVGKFIPIPEKVVNFIWNSVHILPIEMILGDIDIFHSSDWIQPPSRAKMVTTIHDLIIYTNPQTSNDYIISTHKKRLEWVKKDVDCVFADSNCTKDDIVRILEIPEQLIHVIYPGISNEFSIQPKQEVDRVKRKYSLFEDYLLSVGTMEPRKNLKTLLTAFCDFERHSLVKSYGKPIELVIAGNSGWGEKPPVSKYVRMLGFVDQKDLPALYSGALAFVYPSLYEGFGLPILEAMASGCPVVTSPAGSLKEIAGKYAMMIDPMNPTEISQKLVQIVVDSNLRKTMIKEAKSYVDRFNWNSYARKVINVYETLGKGLSQ